MHEIKTADVYEDFNNDKQMFDFKNYLVKSKYYDNSNKLMVGKMTDVIMKIKMFCWIRNECLRHSMNRIQSKDMKYDIMKSTRFLSLTLKMKYTSKTIDVVD